MATVLITGANRGIGLALTLAYLKQGHQVIATCRKISSELAETDAKVYENIDITKIDDLKKVADECPAIDILVNNAGVMKGDNLENLEYDNLRWQFEVNTLGPLKVTKAFLPKLSSRSKIAIISSRMGSVADNTSGGSYGYRLSKSAVNSIGKSLAEDLKERGITVLLLHPGHVRTDMTRGNGLLDATESAVGMLKIIEQKEHSQTGTFWHTSGEQLLW